MSVGGAHWAFGGDLMVVWLDRRLMDGLSELRAEPTPFRIRGLAGPQVVVDSRDALLVWRARWVTPVYAVPARDVRVPVQELGLPRALTESEQRRPVLDPSVAFDAHTGAGRVVQLDTAGGPVAGFVSDDRELAGAVLVDFVGLRWWEEDQEVSAHPRDPSQRIDARPVHARLELFDAGVRIVDTTRAVLLWEHLLPVRWYVPEEDVLVPVAPSGTITWCAYKGRATYRTLTVGERSLEDVAWVYEQPLSDGVAVQGLLGFFTERLDAVLDGRPLAAPAFP